MSEEFDYPASLKKARDIIAVDQSTHMPKGAVTQRAKMLATLDRIIAGEPAASNDSLSPYEKLKAAMSDYNDIYCADEIVSWANDTQAQQETEDAFDNALAALRLTQKRQMSHPDIRTWIKEIDPASLAEKDRINFSLIKKAVQAADALPESFVVEQSSAYTKSFNTWRQAKPASDFAAWQPELEQVVKYAREEAKLLGAALGMEPYQVLLDKYNAGLKVETVHKMFDELRKKLPPLIKEVTAQQANEPKTIALPPVPIEVQKKMTARLMSELGLSDNIARLDKSSHPFSTGLWDDVRITTRYDENDVLSALTSTVHEIGHAHYSHALPREWMGQPAGDAKSMWVHETQSLFWEVQVGGSHEFMEYLSNLMKDELTKANITFNENALAPENIYRLSTRVAPSLIRVGADGLTYPLHIVLRGMEEDLISGALDVKDLPARWAKDTEEMFGLTIPDHAHGCMQDIHWSDGSIGYFPAYVFGILGAAQLMEQAKKDIPDIKENIRSGHFKPILKWLNTHVHQHASLISGEEMIKNATGKPLSADAWFASARERFLPENKWLPAENPAPISPKR